MIFTKTVAIVRLTRLTQKHWKNQGLFSPARQSPHKQVTYNWSYILTSRYILTSVSLERNLCIEQEVKRAFKMAVKSLQLSCFLLANTRILKLVECTLNLQVLCPRGTVTTKLVHAVHILPLVGIFYTLRYTWNEIYSLGSPSHF